METKAKQIKAESTEVRQHEIFNLVKHNGSVQIALGNTIVHSKKFKSFAEAEKAIAQKDWELIINATAFFIQMSNQNKK